jgi:type VI secretion system protein ImpE
MKAEELVMAGRLEEALADLQNAVRSKPEGSRLRIFLFQIQCVMGKWEKALVQLQVLADLNAETFLLSRVFHPIIQCEQLRAEIFAGKRTPIIFGEPMEWVGLMVQACGHAARSEFTAARALRDLAFEGAPGTPGQVDGQSFAWIADADSSLGPILELILEGRYLWAPFCRIRRIQLEKPADLRDLVWMPARVVWTNGGEASVHIPTRYAGTVASTDGSLRLARKTEWIQHQDDYCTGLGQRVLATDQGEHPLLECRVIELTPAA